MSKARVCFCLLLLFTLVASTGSRVQAAGSEQLIFSGTAGSIGFWIWCQAESNNNYAGECNGAMYFYDLGITQHVIDSAPPQETAEGIYTISVVSTGKHAVACTLSNSAEAVHGPHNSVHIDCTTPSVSADANNAVVVVTGH